MDSIYPQGPESIPENLTKPTSGYKAQAWLAMFGLLMFIVLYTALTGWFIWSAYHIISIEMTHRKTDIFAWVAAFGAIFLSIFMLKALLFVRHGGEISDLEIKEEDEPTLFKFLYRLADEAGAPRPHRVFLSGDVNAAVFYDLNIFNLFFPSKKNLVVGLPLVNVLTLGEFKAVLAHEFGHFAQKSMAVGRWVYMAQQIAAHIIAKRDALDKFLRGLNRFDLRIAWVGWVLTLIVWSIRSLLETAFSIVVMAQRALSREMEFQADLVAVSLSGSDSLIHALHKLQAADEAWERTLRFAGSQLSKGAATQDLFEIQKRVIEKMRLILDDNQYGSVPAIPTKEPEAHRVFTAEVAQPPRMWATHPFNHEREENAKRVYVPAALDERSSWVVFSDSAALKQSFTRRLLAAKEAQEQGLEDSLLELDEEYKHRYLNRFYRGAYLGRSVVIGAERPQDLFTEDLPDLKAALGSLYPNSLTEDLEQLRNLKREKALLQALQEGLYSAPGGVIRHRGKELQKNELPGAIAEVREEIQQVQTTIWEHDRLCRSAHIMAAKVVGHGWYGYIRGLIYTLHYADHAYADLRDVQGFLSNVVAVITADRHVSSREIKRLLRAAGDVYGVLQGLYSQAPSVQLDAAVRDRLQVESWQQMIGELELPPPSRENINDWMNAIDSWINSLAGACSALSHTALELLLASETEVSRSYHTGKEIEPAPAPGSLPANYPVLVPGNERELQKKLDLWDRFQTADGIVAASARFIVAAGIVGAAFYVGFMFK